MRTTSHLLLPGATLEEACDTWHAAGARLVVITLGGLGSLDGLRVTVPTPAVDVADTVGAGDSFTAGLLHRLAALGRLGGRLDRLSLEDVTDACSFAARVAALTRGQGGAWSGRKRRPAPQLGRGSRTRPQRTPLPTREGSPPGTEAEPLWQWSQIKRLRAAWPSSSVANRVAGAVDSGSGAVR